MEEVIHANTIYRRISNFQFPIFKQFSMTQ